MKKSAIALMLILTLTTPSYAVNVIDTMVCKKVFLFANSRTVLVNRLTGEVKYILDLYGQWVLLKGKQKKICQAMYDAQTNHKKP